MLIWCPFLGLPRYLGPQPAAHDAEPDKYKVKGGVEFGFMSATLDR